MKASYKKLSTILILGILMASVAYPSINLAQESSPPETEIRIGGRSPFGIQATIQKEINIALSAGDLATWSNTSRNVYGDWIWTLPEDSEILTIEFWGDSNRIEGNKIYFYGLNGYVRVSYRTSTGIYRNGRYLTFASSWSVSEPFDLNAEITFPEFYGNHITSLTPDNYIIQPSGSLFWHSTNISEWSLEIVFQVGLDITAVTFPSGNKTAHHTSQWPDFVFRRAQWLSVKVEFEGLLNPETDSLRWSVADPNQRVSEIPAWTPSLSDTYWAVREGALIGQSLIMEIFIPAKAAIGPYTLQVNAYRDTGEGNILQDSETSPDFGVIFNPWNDDDDPRYDEDVYNPGFDDDELGWYAASDLDINYYPDGITPVFWALGPFDEDVFLPVFEDVTGVSSARTAMQRLVDMASEILDGQWGWSPNPYKADWRDVPAIMSEWDNGNKHPTGQCMDFGGLVSSFARAIGVPARMLTCLNCADGLGGVWEFHVWNEVWIKDVSSDYWSPVDATYDIGPTTIQDPFIQQEVSTSTGIYAYDARTKSRDILLEYYLTSTASLEPTGVTNPLQAITLTVGTSRSVYDFGDTVTILVTATNNSAVSYSGVLRNSISAVDYAGAHEFYTYPARNVTIPAGGTVVETYLLSQADYKWNGDFRASATLDTANASSRFEIRDGLDMQLITPSQVVIGQSFGVSLRITNTLAVQVSNLSIDVYFPSSVNGVSNPTHITIPSLAAGEAYTISWTVSVSDPGIQSVVAYASSAGAGYDQTYASFTALGHADLTVLIEVPASVTPTVPFNAVATVRNDGGLTATNVQVVLSLSGGLSTTAPLTVSVGNLAAGQEREVVWSLVASTAGVHTLQVNATETSVGNSELTTQLVVSVQEPHNIALTATQQIVNSLNPVTVTLTLQNFGNVQDSILLNVISDNPNTGFTVYDGTTPLKGAVTVPAHGSHALSLVIRPRRWESGVVYVRAISKLDPNAVDYLTIAVRGWLSTVFLPTVTRNY